MDIDIHEFHTTVVLALFVEFNESGLSLPGIQEKIDWEIDEIRPALDWLVSKGYVTQIEAPGFYALTPDYVGTI